MLKNKLVKFISVLASASMLVSSAVTVAHAAKVTLAEKLFDSGNKAYVHPTTGENWYYLATPYVFNDGNIQVYSRHIDSENASFTEGSHESMKYRLHLDKPLTYNGKTSNAVAIGYNGTYNTVADAESGSTNAPYIQYSVPTDAVDLSTPETNTNLTMETLVRCDNDAGAYFHFQQNYIDKNDSTKTGNNGQNDLLRFTKDNKITVNGTEVGTWTKGTVYKAAVEFKVGTPYANVYIDDVLVAENANALWGHTFTGLTYIRYYANFSDVQTTNAEELVWFDDFKVYSGVYPVVTSLNSQATVTEESNLVYLETSMTVEEALEKLAYNGDLVCMDKNYTVKSGSDVVVTGDIITASDRNFTRAYDVLTAEPETNSIGDVTYTCNDTACDYNTFEAGTIKASVDVNIVDEPETVAIIIAEYDENGLVQMKFNEETVTSSKTVDVSADVTDETHNVKIMVWNSMTGMLPVKNVLSLRNDRVNVFIASDSIAADYTDEWYPQGGWGMFLGDYMTDEVYVANEADPGETAKSFYNNFWSDIKDNLKAGDYVIVSFMHNDIYALSKTGESYQSVEEYREYLAKYYEEATAAGANVIYLTGFNRGEITDTHIQTVDDVEYNYVTEMKNVVDSLDGAICLDLHQKIMDYLTTADAEGKLEEVKGEIYLYNLIENGWLENTVQLTTHKNSTLRNYGKDLTHLNLNGADKAAGWIADLINSSESPLAEYIK